MREREREREKGKKRNVMKVRKYARERGERQWDRVERAIGVKEREGMKEREKERES